LYFGDFTYDGVCHEGKEIATILFIHPSILVAVITMFTVNPRTRYLRPISILTILIIALLGNRFLQRSALLRPRMADGGERRKF